MRKWTYLVAALLSAGVTVGTFSSCIDNDEPEGINILRKAKAELITAKKALVEAQAKQAEAEAQKALIEAEAEKARVEIEKLQAEAEEARANAESAAEVARIEAEIAQIKAETESMLQQAEILLQTLTVNYQTALQELEKAKLEMSEYQAERLEFWYSRFFTAQAEYTTAYNEYLTAQREYLKAQIDGDATDYDTEKTKRDNVESAQVALDEANETLAKLNESLEAAKEMEPSELGAKKDEWSQEKRETMAAIANIDLEKAELQKANIAEYDKEGDLNGEILKLEAEEIEIAEYKETLPEIGIPNFRGEQEIVVQGLKFRVDRNEAIYGNYYTALNALNIYKSNIQNLLLDDDDRAWTAARINELKTEKAAAEAAYEEALPAWETAVKAYNEGKGADITVFNNYADLEDAIDAYNATLPALNAAKAAAHAADEARDAAHEAYIDAPDAWNTKNLADDEAKATRDAALDAAQAAYNAKVDPAQATVSKKLAAYWEALEKANAAYDFWQNTDPESTAYEAEWNTLDAAATTAYADYETAQKALNTAVTEAGKARTLAENTAERNCREALAENERIYIETLIANGWRSKDPALWNAYQDAREKADDAWEAFWEAHNATEETLEAIPTSTWNLLNEMTMANLCDPDAVKINFINAHYWDKDFTYEDASVSDVITLETYVAKMLVLNNSQNVFGYLPRDTQNDNLYWDVIPDNGRLLPLTQEGVDEIIKNAYPNIEDYQIPNYYLRFNLLGQVLNADYKIAVAEAYLANKDVVEGVIANAQAAIDELEASKDKQIELIKEAIDAHEAQLAVIEELEKPLNDKEVELRKEMNIINRLLAAVQYAIDATGGDGDDDGEFLHNYTQQTIDNYIAKLEEEIKNITDGNTATGDKGLKELQDELDRAQYLLDAWLSGELSNAADKKFELEKAEYDLEVAKQKMDYYKADLDKAIERLEAAE